MGMRAITYRYRRDRVVQLVSGLAAGLGWSLTLVLLSTARPDNGVVLVPIFALLATLWSRELRRRARAFVRLTPGEIAWSDGSRALQRVPLAKAQIRFLNDLPLIETPTGRFVLRADLSGLDDLRFRLRNLTPERIADPLPPGQGDKDLEERFRTNPFPVIATWSSQVLVITLLLSVLYPAYWIVWLLSGTALAFLDLYFRPSEVVLGQGHVGVRSIFRHRCASVPLGTVRGVTERNHQLWIAHDAGETPVPPGVRNEDRLKHLLTRLGAERYEALATPAVQPPAREVLRG